MNQLIATIGHSVVRKWDESWIPSGLYQEITFPDGPHGKIQRTHIEIPNLAANSDHAYLGGGQAVVEALRRLWWKDKAADVAIIGGRPASMDKAFGDQAFGVTEAQVMAGCLQANLFSPEEVRLVIDTKNTEDDMRALLNLAYEYNRTTVIAMGFRLPRCRLLMEDFVARNLEYSDAGERITFVDAEQFLPDWFDQFVEMNQSAAYRLTMSQERFGVEKLLKARAPTLR